MAEQNPKPSTQAFIFLGSDDFSLRRKIDTWKREYAKKFSQDAIVQLERTDTGETDMVAQLEQALSPSLFSTRKLVIAKDFLPAKASEEKLGEYLLHKLQNLPKDYFLVLWQSSKPDRRLGMVKKIFAIPLTVTEFELPHGKMLNSWIKSYAKTLGLELDDNAIEELAIYLGRDFYEEKKAGGKVIERKEAFDLWQVHSEVTKLASYTSRADIGAIRALVKPKMPENVFALTDEIAKKNSQSSLKILEQLLSQPAADEKNAIIKIIGLLAEQVRAMLVVKTLQSEGKSQQDIADALGWSSGRVFITSKNSTSQKTDNLSKMLGQLTEIDSKLKSTDESPKLLIDQFILAACR